MKKLGRKRGVAANLVFIADLVLIIRNIDLEIKDIEQEILEAEEVARDDIRKMVAEAVAKGKIPPDKKAEVCAAMEERYLEHLTDRKIEACREAIKKLTRLRQQILLIP
jgi:hypothetical protein